MQTQEVKEKSTWDEKKENDILQSWDYGEILRSAGREIWRLQTKDGEQTRQIQCIIRRGRFGIVSAYVGRILIDSGALQAFLAYVQSRNFSYVRVEPKNDISPLPRRIILAKNAQPRHEWILDVRRPLPDILADMHSKTRYNIRVAERHGIRIEEKKDLELFWRLNRETVRRDKYNGHTKAFAEAVIASPMAMQFSAWDGETPIATAVLLRHRDTLLYFYGASATAGRHTMAPTLLQWHAIQYAKKIGCSEYDFWGIATPKERGAAGPTDCFHRLSWDPRHPYSAVTRFKVGFGGYARSYPQAFDVVFHRPSYLVSRVTEVLCK